MSLKELVNTVNVKSMGNGVVYIEFTYKDDVGHIDTIDRVNIASEIGDLILERINGPADSEWTADKIMEREG